MVPSAFQRPPKQRKMDDFPVKLLLFFFFVLFGGLLGIIFSSICTRGKNLLHYGQSKEEILLFSKQKISFRPINCLFVYDFGREISKMKGIQEGKEKKKKELSGVMIWTFSKAM